MCKLVVFLLLLNDILDIIALSLGGGGRVGGAKKMWNTVVLLDYGKILMSHGYTRPEWLRKRVHLNNNKNTFDKIWREGS